MDSCSDSCSLRAYDIHQPLVVLTRLENTKEIPDNKIGMSINSGERFSCILEAS